MKVTKVDKKTGQVFNTSIYLGDPIPTRPEVAAFMAKIHAEASKWTREDILAMDTKMRISKGLPPRTIEEIYNLSMKKP